ncbi:T9SS type A sorting domain-containing protein [Aureispira]|nr:T9SS type A sorting domain-containing protein [Aureispira sp.]
MGAHNLTVGSVGVISNYNTNNFVITNDVGVLKQTISTGSTKVFPVGTASTSYTPATLNNIGVGDDFEVRVSDNVYVWGTAGSIEVEHVVDKTWHIEESVVGGSDVTLTLQWNTNDEALYLDKSNCGIAHHISGSLWDNPGFGAATQIGTSQNYNVSRSGFTSFSPFVVRDPFATLPIELLTFEAARIDADLVQLDWATASETNNKGFEIQRMLENETDFKTVGFMDGMGTTVNTTYYQHDDINSYTDMSYYRLKQVDIDDKFSFSQIKAVSGLKDKDPNYIDVNTFPNPVGDELIIEFMKIPIDVTSASIKIINVSGQVLCDIEREIKYNQIIQIEYVKNLVPAAYMLSINLDNGHRITQKFIKN